MSIEPEIMNPYESENEDISKGIESEGLTSDALRAIQEVQVQALMAQKNPRNERACYGSLKAACERYTFANTALYSYPKGKQTVVGPSIRMAETLAQKWKNINYGIRELKRETDMATAEAYAWDIESNVRVAIEFKVELRTKRNNADFLLTDARDIYEHVANHGARRLRNCILKVIPSDVVEACVLTVKDTMKKGPGNKTLEERIRELVVSFKTLGISEDHLKEKLGHSLDLTTVDELVELQPIYVSIRDKTAKKESFFNLGPTQDDNSRSLSDKLKNLNKKTETPKATKKDEFGDFELDIEDD